METKGEDVVDLSGDGGVLKRVKKGGTSGKPPERAKVQVHYTGKFEDGKVFDSSLPHNKPLVFALGKQQVIKGWDLGVGSMEKGEQAELICRSDYAYGEEGSPPNIPPNATLHFDVELVDWSDPDPETVDERLKAAELAKTKGNDLYKEKKYEEAMRHYNQGLDYFNQLWSLEEEEKKKVDAVKLSLLLNLAACQQELGEYSEVYYSCCKALDIDTYNVKALYRRGKALSAQNEFEKAKADLYEAAKLAPNAKEIRVELDLLKKKIEANKQKQKDLFAAMMK